MKTEVDSDQRTCGKCANNEDGLCDYLGRLVDDDDDPGQVCNWMGWEKFQNRF